MTTDTRSTVKKHRKTGYKNVFQYLFLILLLGALIYFCARQISAYKAENNAPDKQQALSETASESYILHHADESERAKGNLVLINGAHPYKTSEEPKLVSIFDYIEDCYFVRDKNVMIEEHVMEHLNGLLKAFYEATGIDDVNVVSGYRTFDEQQGLYTASVEENGEAHTAMFVAQPGCSEHHTGLALDLSIYHINDGTSEEFDGDGPYGWIAENGWQYGFVLRYPESKYAITNVGSEPWHFRYVGIPHACYMKEHDLCLEEYIELLHQYPYDGEHLVIEWLGQTYEVYFCPGTDVYIPSSGDCAVSGDNMDGFVVTATLSG